MELLIVSLSAGMLAADSLGVYVHSLNNDTKETNSNEVHESCFLFWLTITTNQSVKVFHWVSLIRKQLFILPGNLALFYNQRNFTHCISTNLATAMETWHISRKLMMTMTWFRKKLCAASVGMWNTKKKLSTTKSIRQIDFLRQSFHDGSFTILTLWFIIRLRNCCFFCLILVVFTWRRIKKKLKAFNRQTQESDIW